MSADGVRVNVKRSGICHIASGRVRNDRDVIANLSIVRITCLRIKRIAHRNVRRPRQSTVDAEGIKQLRVDVVCSIARVVPHHINTAIRCYRKCAKIVPLALMVGIIIDTNRCVEGESAIGAPCQHYLRGGLTTRLYTRQHVNIVVCRRPGAVYRDECLAAKSYAIDSALKKKAAQINLSILIKRRCLASDLCIRRAKASELAAKI